MSVQEINEQSERWAKRNANTMTDVEFWRWRIRRIAERRKAAEQASKQEKN